MAKKKARKKAVKRRKSSAKKTGKKHCAICKTMHAHPAWCRLKRLKSRKSK